MKTLGWVDYLVIAIMLCISAGIGVYYRFSGGRQKTMEVIIITRFFFFLDKGSWTFNLYFLGTIKIKFFFSYIFLLQWKVICFTGVLRCKSINEHYTCRCRLGGLFHVCCYAAWCVRWELYIWDTICCNKPIVSVGHSDCMLWIPTSILQIAGDERLRGESSEIWFWRWKFSIQCIFKKEYSFST